MLQFSRPQLAAFELEAMAHFERALVAFARRTLPRRTEGLDDEGLQRIVRRCLDAAHHHGVRWQNNIAKIFLAYLQYEQIVLEEEEIREYLSGTGDPDRFLRHIFGGAFEGVWKRLAARRSLMTRSGGPNVR